MKTSNPKAYIFRSRVTFSICIAILPLLISCAAATKDSNEQAKIQTPQLRPTTLHATLDQKPLMKIAHRGASMDLPEHTLEAYALAIEQGADFIEPDLVSTKDGVLIARHENEISATTNIKDIYPNRQATKTIDGEKVTGWFTEDFTASELSKVRARQRLPFRSQVHNDRYKVPRLSDILDLAKRRSKELKRTIGVYPETKHPSYHRQIGLPLEPKLLSELKRRGFTKKSDPIVIQSFEPESVKLMRGQTQIRLVQLLDEPPKASDEYARAFSPNDTNSIQRRLAEIAKYADGVGVHKGWIVNGKDGAMTSFIDDAHKAGLFVHAWTFRSEPQFLHARYDGNPELEYQQFALLGVDGIFSEDIPRLKRRLETIALEPKP